MDNFKKGEKIYATKASTGRFVLAPEGTIIKSNEGEVKIRSGELVQISELNNSVYITDFSEYLNRYIADPSNPASREMFKLIESYQEDVEGVDELGVKKLFEELVEKFIDLDREVNIAKDYLNNTDIETLRGNYKHAMKLSNVLDREMGEKINSLDFEERLNQARDILLKIRSNDNLTDEIKDIKESYVMAKLLPKTNNHQHLKGSVPENIILELAERKGFSGDEIQELKDTYKKAEDGFKDLNEFNKAYGTIGRVIRRPEDYKMAIKGIVENAVEHSQLSVEIRSAVIGQEDENGEEQDPISATENILNSIEEIQKDLGNNSPAVGFTFLGYRGRDWHPEEVIEHAELAVKFSKKYPNKKFSFDIAGPEDTGYSPNHFKEGYDLILDYNKKIESGELEGETIGITTHAGETPTYDNDESKKGADAVKETIELGAHRLGHGVQMDEEAMIWAKAKNICVEVPGTCNIDTIFKNTEFMPNHPANEFFKNNVPITLATDNDAISGTNISKEFLRFMISGHGQFMNWNNLKDIAMNGVVSSFISDEEKKIAIDKFNYRVRKIEKLILEVRMEDRIV